MTNHRTESRGFSPGQADAKAAALRTHFGFVAFVLAFTR